MTGDARPKSEYSYSSAAGSCAHEYLVQPVLKALRSAPGVRRVLDAGCGNGAVSGRLEAAGLEVSGFDASTSGIEHASQAWPRCRFRVASVYDDLLQIFGARFDAVVSLEVVEHLYDPRKFLCRLSEVLRPGGLLILSTPYHGYLKNVALAVSGRLDDHFTALWDGGHIKFWSRRTLSRLVDEAGLKVVRVEGAGRVPLLWKSMILVAEGPAGNPASFHP